MSPNAPNSAWQAAAIHLKMLQQICGKLWNCTLIRENLNLSVRDIIEWKVERGKVFVSPVHKEFLKYRNSIKTGSGDISEDIRLARERRTEKYL